VTKKLEKVEISTQYDTDTAKKFSSCWTYQQEIQFDPSRKSKRGKSIPFNEDESLHDCPNRRHSFDTTQDENRPRQFAADSYRLASNATGLMQEQKELIHEVHIGFDHIVQRLNDPQDELQKLQTLGRQ
jgi:hypothetical protein